MDSSDLKPGDVITGPKWPEPISLKMVEQKGDYLRIVASTIHTNAHIDQMVSGADLAQINIQTITTDFGSDAWKVFLALETKRCRFASIYDPLLAMNTSKIDPLPHQIEAVYGYVLRQIPSIRFLLAHDPGAGKTIMAGLIIKELKLRNIVQRILIIAPGHLKDQWRREMKEKFEEPFVAIDRSYIKSLFGENAWKKENQIITSLDFAKQDDIRDSLGSADFDLVIVDEAHKMSAMKYGDKTQKTDRYKLGAILSENTEHLLFLTATPHKGDPENFKLFLDLLNPGFFETPEMLKDSLKKGDNPLFLRRLKDDMVDFDKKPLFLPRKVMTPDIKLSDREIELYNEVSMYVREQYNKALQTERRSIGFALIILQRRLASSTHALLQSLLRRKRRLEDLASSADKKTVRDMSPKHDIEDVEEMSEEERWREESLWETLSVAGNREELEKEISTLGRLMAKAREIISSETEEKIRHLRNALGSEGKEKILIFTESKDTLDYISGKIAGWGYSVNTIHGGMPLESRIEAESIFKNDTQVMVATEAAGEGINLQFCHFMINYDLPWNPNRLEQRMGRIHRYGQQREVTIFNLVASNTREGQIMSKLFDKLAEIKTAMGSDKVFDVVSEVLHGTSLEQLLMKAVMDERDQAEIIREIDVTVSDDYIQEMRQRLGDSLATEFMDHTSIKEMKNKAIENKMIPKYTKDLFMKAFSKTDSKLRERADGFVAVDSISYDIKKLSEDEEFKKSFGSMLKSYPKITFDKEEGFKNQDAEFVTFGHPLFESTLKWIEEKFTMELQRGATFSDPMGDDGYVVFHEGEIKDGTDQVAGKRLFAHFVDPGSKSVRAVSPTIIWDLYEQKEPMAEPGVDVEVIKENVLQHVMKSLEVYSSELQDERNRQAGIKEKYGVESLRLLIKRLDDELIDLEIKRQKGKNMDIAIRNKQEKKRKSEEQKANLETAIKKEQSLTMSTPSFVGIIRVKQPAVPGEPPMKRDPEVEAVGMRLAMQYERDCGREPEDVSKENTGFDIRSKGEDGTYRYIEVKARAAEGQVSLSRNEWYQAAQIKDSYYLYIIWNAANNPNPKPKIVQDPAKNLDVRELTVQYIVSAEEIRSKSS